MSNEQKLRIYLGVAYASVIESFSWVNGDRVVAVPISDVDPEQLEVALVVINKMQRSRKDPLVLGVVNPSLPSHLGVSDIAAGRVVICEKQAGRKVTTHSPYGREYVESAIERGGNLVSTMMNVPAGYICSLRA
ncbi:MAG: hypothetical protein Q7S79_02375 [bacterium]|nr:hypothetical protein [bacterium]